MAYWLQQEKWGHLIEGEQTDASYSKCEESKGEGEEVGCSLMKAMLAPVTS